MKCLWLDITYLKVDKVLAQSSNSHLDHSKRNRQMICGKRITFERWSNELKLCKYNFYAKIEFVSKNRIKCLSADRLSISFGMVVLYSTKSWPECCSHWMSWAWQEWCIVGKKRIKMRAVTETSELKVNIVATEWNDLAPRWLQTTRNRKKNTHINTQCPFLHPKKMKSFFPYALQLNFGSCHDHFLSMDFRCYFLFYIYFWCFLRVFNSWFSWWT